MFLQSKVTTFLRWGRKFAGFVCRIYSGFRVSKVIKIGQFLIEIFKRRVVDVFSREAVCKFTEWYSSQWQQNPEPSAARQLVSVGRCVTGSCRRWWSRAGAGRLVAFVVPPHELNNSVYCPDHQTGKAEELHTHWYTAFYYCITQLSPWSRG